MNALISHQSSCIYDCPCQVSTSSSCLLWIASDKCLWRHWRDSGTETELSVPMLHGHTYLPFVMVRSVSSSLDAADCAAYACVEGGESLQPKMVQLHAYLAVDACVGFAAATPLHDEAASRSIRYERHDSEPDMPSSTTTEIPVVTSLSPLTSLRAISDRAWDSFAFDGRALCS